MANDANGQNEPNEDKEEMTNESKNVDNGTTAVKEPPKPLQKEQPVSSRPYVQEIVCCD